MSEYSFKKCHSYIILYFYCLFKIFRKSLAD